MARTKLEKWCLEHLPALRPNEESPMTIGTFAVRFMGLERSQVPGMLQRVKLSLRWIWGIYPDQGTDGQGRIRFSLIVNPKQSFEEKIAKLQDKAGYGVLEPFLIQFAHAMFVRHMTKRPPKGESVVVLRLPKALAREDDEHPTLECFKSEAQEAFKRELYAMALQAKQNKKQLQALKRYLKTL